MFLWTATNTLLHYAMLLGLLMSVGTVITSALFRFPLQRVRAQRFATLAIAASIMSFALKAVELTGEWQSVIDTDLLALIWATPVGTALALRVVGLTMLLFAGNATPFGAVLGAVGSILAIASFPYVGHTSTSEHFWLPMVLAVHVGAAAIWIGVLTPLKNMLADTDSYTDGYQLAVGFGAFASWSVPLLLALGAVLAYTQLGSIRALFTEPYGWALLLKTALVASLLALAAWNKLRLVPGLSENNRSAADALIASINKEWIAVHAIVLTTAYLSTSVTPPG